MTPPIEATPSSQPLPCIVRDSGLGRAPFRLEGANLAIEMVRLEADLPQADGPEEMLAVIEGSVRVVCPGESHELRAGQGVLVPADLSRGLEVHGAALIYRGRRK